MVQSFKLEFVRNKYLKPFPKIFVTIIWNSILTNIKYLIYPVFNFKTNMKNIYLASKYQEFKGKTATAILIYFIVSMVKN